MKTNFHNSSPFLGLEVHEGLKRLWAFVRFHPVSKRETAFSLFSYKSPEPQQTLSYK